METNQNQQYRFRNEPLRTLKLPAINVPITYEHRITYKHHENQDPKEVVPGVSIVRSNTPRPRSFGAMRPSEEQHHDVPLNEPVPLPAFPSKAPSAPPLPEELGEGEEDHPSSSMVAIPTTGGLKAIIEDSQEFIWIFEYGLEMDTAILNSPERLDGLALLYGPAVLKGYSIMFGTGIFDEHGDADRAVVTIVASAEPGAEVWGVLYRIPRRLAERSANEPSLLDTIHRAGTSDSLFKNMRVAVHEIYRNREIVCVTYFIADTVRQRFHLLSLQQGGDKTLLAQRLAMIARKQKLPDKYLGLYLSPSSFSPQTAAISEHGQGMPPLRGEPDTEPLPALKNSEQLKSSEQTAIHSTPKVAAPPRANRWLITFALYLMLVFLIMLTFAVLQGLGFGGNDLLTSFKPLGVPGLVLVYGLLGGCISSIVTLGRCRVANPPIYVVITWFTRPYIGSVLAILTYLLLTSGFFVITDDSGKYHAFFLLVGALAGLCEGWLFFRRN